MGKYTTTRAFQRDRERKKSGSGDSFSDTVDYLIGVPDNETQFRLQEFMYGFDPTGIYRGFINQRDMANYWNDYFKNTGLDWSDIKYPSMMRGYGAAGTTSRNAQLFISKNLSRLYR